MYLNSNISYFHEAKCANWCIISSCAHELSALHVDCTEMHRYCYFLFFLDIIVRTFNSKQCKLIAILVPVYAMPIIVYTVHDHLHDKCQHVYMNSCRHSNNYT